MKRAITLCVLLLLAFAATPQAFAQCNFIGTVTNPAFSPTTMFITKTFAPAGDCQTTAKNAHSCHPGPIAFNRTMLYAAAYSATVNPYCKWVCDCGPGFTSQALTIDIADGLPVELKEFSVDE